MKWKHNFFFKQKHSKDIFSSYRIKYLKDKFLELNHQPIPKLRLPVVHL